MLELGCGRSQDAHRTPQPTTQVPAFRRAKQGVEASLSLSNLNGDGLQLKGALART
jgi:hypothetical protein